MRITFLGTGTSQGIPVVACSCEVCKSSDYRDKRLRTSVMIENNETCLVIDAGPDFRQQMLSEEVKKLDAILLTHSHKDHIAGLDDVRSFNWVLQKPMDIYATVETHKVVKTEFSYAFGEDRYPGVPNLNLIEIGTKPFTISGIEVIPISAFHHKTPVLGFRTGDFTYITDANFIPDVELEKIKNSKILVINALRKKKHISHFTLQEALEIIDKVKPDKAYLTHLSHQMGFHQDVEKELPQNVHLAYDGLKVKMDSN